MPEPIKQVLMERDGLTEEQAEKRINEARSLLMDQIASGEASISDFCYDEFDLEPDYLEELIY